MEKQKKKASRLKIESSIIDGIFKFRHACSQIRKATQALREVTKNSKSLRVEFLKQRAKDYAKKNNTTAEKELKKILHVERQRNQSIVIQAVLKRKGRGGPTSILIPAATEYDDNDGSIGFHLNIDRMWTRLQKANGHDIKNWERISNRNQMEDLMLKWQRRHFEQANETPLATTKWKHKLMEDKIQMEIQEGTFKIPPNFPLEVKQIIKQMRRPNCIKRDIPTITKSSDFRHFVKITKEKTSSSPSGRHYGHYKSMMEGKATLMHVIHGIIELAVQHNVILER